MTRTRSALAAAVLSGALLGGCVGGGDASQDGVHDKIEDRLIDPGYRPNTETAFVRLSPEVADAVAGCVSRTMFESTDWTKDERNDVNRSSDGEPADPELVIKLTVLLESCIEEETPAVGPVAGDSGDEDDEESTTTTEE